MRANLIRADELRKVPIQKKFSLPGKLSRVLCESAGNSPYSLDPQYLKIIDATSCTV